MAADPPLLHDDNLFAARDVTYLREIQYATIDKLSARILLHSKYSVSKIDWFTWLRSQIEWSAFESVLEVGCGTGILWSTLPSSAHERLRLVLADLSPSMVESSIKQIHPRLSNVTGLVANVQTLPFENASFDLVIANQMLYHAFDPAAALAEIHRVLRPGGVLLASTIGPRHLLELFEIEAMVLGRTLARSHAEVFGSISGRELLAERFDHVEWRAFDDELLCTNTDDVVAYLTSTPPGESATTEELQQLREEIERRRRRGHGVLRVTKDSGTFIARRTFRRDRTF